MLSWNVYIGDFNSGKIKCWNIFNHWFFYDSCVKAKKKYKDNMEGFAEDVRSNLMYYFWSKCEYEVVIQPWPSGELYELREDVKIRHLNQMMSEAGIKYPRSNTFRLQEDREVTIHVFPKDNVFHDRKIDVYEQVMNNWDIFIRYLWDNRKQLKARK